MMGNGHTELSALLGRVRRRWRLVTGLRAWSLGAAGASGILALALIANWFVAPESAALVLLWMVAGAASLACLVWVIVSIKSAPADTHIARLIEEHCPELEDVLATAVGQRKQRHDPMADAVLGDAVRRTRNLEGDRIISRRAVSRAAMLAMVSTLALAVSWGLSARPVSQATHILGLYLFPDWLSIDVTPGDVRIRAGDSLRVVARISSSGAVTPVLRVQDAGQSQEIRMVEAPEGFAASFESVQRDFQYRVSAAGTASREYTVQVIRPPQVERIDLQYTYPPAFGMPARAEDDGGDIYGPAGTRVRVIVHTDKPVTRAALNQTAGPAIVLDIRERTLEGELTITEDGSYRIALVDADGLNNPGETEYFIRTIQDSPPDVRITLPASDRQVTAVEEVSVEARAEDDFGVASLDLVYMVGAGAEKVVPFNRVGSRTAITGRHTLYLEDLSVQPGDFVTYYARARDVSRGKRSSEARSDIFFLEVTPFEQEFVASQNEGREGGGDDDRTLESLIQPQKDIITATWNLDRRGREAGSQSQEDVHAVGHAQRDLRTKAIAIIAQMERANEVRRRRLGEGRGLAGADTIVDGIGRAAAAMSKARDQLEAARTAEALPHEMGALRELLRLQAEVQRREVQQQQQARGPGGRFSNREQQDLSSLFDRELARQQQTNYETPAKPESQGQTPDSEDALEKVRELARRQDALNRSQQELARNRERTAPEELRRQLERLTREQSELRRQAEELGRELQQAERQGQSEQSGQGRQSGQGKQSGSSGQSGQSGESGQGGGQSEKAGQDLQRVTEDMQAAASELRRENPEQASARGVRAAEGLRNLEETLRRAQPNERQRAVGELQLESQQLADAQRRLGTRNSEPRTADDRADQARRRASEQERLADRAERLERGVRQLAASQGTDVPERQALNDAVQELDKQRPAQRMRDAARDARQSAGLPGAAKPGETPRQSSGQAGEPRSGGQREGEEIARALDRLANRLGAASGRSEDSQRLTDELSRIRQLREDLAGLESQLSKLRDRGAADQPGSQQSRGAEAGDGAQDGDSQAPWQGVRDLLGEMRGDERLGITFPAAGPFNMVLSAPGTEAWKQDFAKWDELKVQVATALERAERTAAERLRDQQITDRLNAGASQAVPEQYRRLVEKYYRALASQSRERK